MSRRLAVALLALGALACAGSRMALSRDWPPAVPGAREMAGWERIDGDVETAKGRAVYAFYVDPQRNGIYTVARYVVRWGGAEAQTQTEKYVWLRRRHLGLPVCFERGRDGRWSELAVDGDPYQAEMLTATAVFGLHRVARLGNP